MLKGAIIGIGKIAQTGHLPAYLSKQIRERAKVVAAVDPNEKSRMIAAEHYPHLHLYENLDQLFKEERRGHCGCRSSLLVSLALDDGNAL